MYRDIVYKKLKLVANTAVEKSSNTPPPQSPESLRAKTQRQISFRSSQGDLALRWEDGRRALMITFKDPLANNRHKKNSLNSIFSIGLAGTVSKHGENKTFLSLCRHGGGIFLSFFYSWAWYDSNLTRSYVFFFSLHEPHASFSRDVILVPILRLFLFCFFFFFIVGNYQNHIPGGYTLNALIAAEKKTT